MKPSQNTASSRVTSIGAIASPSEMLPMLRGTRVLLRAPLPKDAVDRQAAGRDPEFRRLVGASVVTSTELTSEDAQQWLDQVSRESHSWVIDFEQHCIGVARLHTIDDSASQAHLAIGIFSPTHRGRGLGTEAVQLLVRYAFDSMSLATLRLRVLAFNSRAIACYERCGFREIAREQTHVDGAEVTDLIMELHGSNRPTDGSANEFPRDAV